MSLSSGTHNGVVADTHVQNAKKQKKKGSVVGAGSRLGCKDNAFCLLV